VLHGPHTIAAVPDDCQLTSTIGHYDACRSWRPNGICTNLVHHPPATSSATSATGCVAHGLGFLPTTSHTRDDETRRIDGSVHDHRPLKTSTVATCEVPRTHTSLGDWSFTVPGPHLWNKLPLHQHDLNLPFFSCWKCTCFDKDHGDWWLFLLKRHISILILCLYTAHASLQLLFLFVRNSLLANIRSASVSLQTFARRLKTYLFYLPWVQLRTVYLAL